MAVCILFWIGLGWWAIATGEKRNRGLERLTGAGIRR